MIKGFRFQNCIIKEKVLHLVTQLLSLLFIIGVLYGILGNDTFPGTEVFALILLAVTAYVGGVIVSCLGLPSLLGMLIIGFLFRNLTFIPYHDNISVKWASTLRDISLVIILLKAGLGLDPKKLKELKLNVLKLSSIPCLSEAIGSAVTVHFLLGLPWLWSFMLGFILSAVSAAVLVPGMLAVEEKRLGIEIGIPTLVMAAVSIDNIIALTGLTVMFSIITTSDDLAWTLIKRPIEPLLGFVIGAFIGIFLWYIPGRNSSKPMLVYYRSLLLFTGGLSLEFVSKRMDLAGAGALGCVSLAFVASLEWRTNEDQFKIITWVTGLWWSIIEPFLFGLIGAEVTLEILQTNLGFTFLALLLGVLIRALATVLSLVGAGLNMKERIFVAASWLSKATVQAAVGSQALDYARSNHEDPQFVEYSKQVLTMSVLSIILTAPLGAAFIDYLAPHLLQEDGNSVETSMGSTETEEESACITEVTVTDYGTGRCSNMAEIKGILKNFKPNINM